MCFPDVGVLVSVRGSDTRQNCGADSPVSVAFDGMEVGLRNLLSAYYGPCLMLGIKTDIIFCLKEYISS